MFVILYVRIENSKKSVPLPPVPFQASGLPLLGNCVEKTPQYVHKTVWYDNLLSQKQQRSISPAT